MESEMEGASPIQDKKCWMPPAFLYSDVMIQRAMIIEPFVLAATLAATLAFGFLNESYWYLAVAFLAMYVQTCYDLWLGSKRRDHAKVNCWLRVRTMEFYLLLFFLATHILVNVRSFTQFTPADWIRIVVFAVWRLYTLDVVYCYRNVLKADLNKPTPSTDNQVDDMVAMENLNDKIRTCIFRIASALVTGGAVLVGLIPYITETKDFDEFGIFLVLVVIFCYAIIIKQGYLLYSAVKEKKNCTSHV